MRPNTKPPMCAQYAVPPGCGLIREKRGRRRCFAASTGSVPPPPGLRAAPTTNACDHSRQPEQADLRPVIPNGKRGHDRRNRARRPDQRHNDFGRKQQNNRHVQQPRRNAAAPRYSARNASQPSASSTCGPNSHKKTMFQNKCATTDMNENPRQQRHKLRMIGNQPPLRVSLRPGKAAGDDVQGNERCTSPRACAVRAGRYRREAVGRRVISRTTGGCCKSQVTVVVTAKRKGSWEVIGKRPEKRGSELLSLR